MLRYGVTVCGLVLVFASGMTVRNESRAVERTAAGATKAADLVASPRVLVIAHRGNSSVAPENTLPAFRAAVEVGADLVELDYYHSADGIPVTFHDKTLDRTTDAVARWGTVEVAVTSKSLAELRMLDAGAWFDRRFTGTQIPTLDESLDVIQNGSMTLIERKHGDAKTCIELLRQKQLLDRVVVQAFDWDFLKDCRQLEPSLALGALGGDPLTDEQLAEIQTFSPQVVGWQAKSLDADTIRRIHERGMKAWAWTVDDVDHADALVAAGIDGIITNVPERVRAHLAKPAPIDVGLLPKSQAFPDVK
ncbi:MAG: hypothetical protein KDA63_16085 [Planctomycetales bacterium]|nr:hypothetical protein [Planctomycetales bacterium]